MIPIEANPFIDYVEYHCNTNDGRLRTRFSATCDGYVNSPELHKWLFTDEADKKDAPKLVIFNDPATVVFYNDGSKVVTKAKDGDEYDPLFGLMACALRKVGKNRVRIDSWEHVIEFLAENIGSADECRVLADMLNATADAWELDGVAESMDKWAEEQREKQADGKQADETPESHEPSTEERVENLARGVADFISFAAKATNTKPIANQDEVRQVIRDLIDKGEL